ncbi:MAG: Rieske 2Fe-2S domain-containing protein [Proteobacteria bacterium]|nr:Rieske 2Fe-2S domain-containing protein [Pseudomonadota bacterium]
MAQNGKGISRRTLIGYGWIGAAAIVVGELIGGTLALLWPKVRKEKAKKLLVAGKIDEFKVGQVVLFRKEKVFINRTEEGLLALSAICPHLRCVVRWTEPKNAFECPCHGGVFNDLGEVVSGPPPRPLDIYEVKVAGNKVVVDTSKAIQRKEFRRSQLILV